MDPPPDSRERPPGLDPGTAFSINVRILEYTAKLDDGSEMKIPTQCHDFWVNGVISLERICEELKSQVLWGTCQVPVIYGCDNKTNESVEIVTNMDLLLQFCDRFDTRKLLLSAKVVDKTGNKVNNVSLTNDTSIDATATDASLIDVSANDATLIEYNADAAPTEGVIDWSKLKVQPLVLEGGGAYVNFDENHLYEMLGLRDEDATSEAAATAATSKKDPPPHSIPAIPPDLEREMQDAAITVNDVVPGEPVLNWDRDNPVMEVGTIFPNMPEFRLAVRQFAIKEEFELGTEKSDPERFRGYCVAEGCPWRIVARTQHDQTVRVQINTGEHKCASASRVIGRMASQAWVADRVAGELRKKPNIGATELQTYLQDKYKVQIPYATVWKGKERAVQQVFGSWDDSFDCLHRFKAEIELRCPGSVVEIGHQEIDGEYYFERFYCCFEPCIRGFLSGCRKYLSIDSTNLNGKWSGNMAAANALDGHNWMYPVAFGFFDSETTDNWTWFMEQLAKSVGTGPNMAISTDACKGFENAVAKIFPNCEQRECFRHLMDNLTKRKTGPLYGNLWPAARAFRLEKFEYHFNKVIAADPEVGEWLEKYHNLLWARCKFSTEIKCDYITNNLAESWNAWIKDYKDLPLDILADSIREKTAILWAKRKKVGQRLKGHALPAIVHQLNAATRGLGHMRVMKGDEISEVTELHDGMDVLRHVVYMKQRECTCREWQLTGKPCPHALAAISTTRNPIMDDYVDPIFSVACFRAAYEGTIPCITDKSQWPMVDKGFKLLPPTCKKRTAGRQRKNRIPSCLEKGKGKIKRQVTCSTCGGKDHRKGSPKCAMTGTKKRKRNIKNKTKVGRKKSKKDAAATEVVQTPPRSRVALTLHGLHDSPGPVTRRQLALISGQGCSQTSQTSPGPVTRRQLAMAASPQPSHVATTRKKITPRKKN